MKTLKILLIALSVMTVGHAEEMVRPNLLKEEVIENLSVEEMTEEKAYVRAVERINKGFSTSSLEKEVLTFIANHTNAEILEETIKTGKEIARLYNEDVIMVSGVRVVLPETAEEINILKHKENILFDALEGRLDKKALSSNIKKFKTMESTYKGQDIIAVNDDYVRKMNTKVVLDVLERLDINEEVLKGITVYISPYQFKLTQGVAITGEESADIIISNIDVPKIVDTKVNITPSRTDLMNTGIYINERYEEEITNTLLHELGHVVDKKLGRISEQTTYRSKVDSLRNSRYHYYGSDVWQNRYNENFAEDFKVFCRTRLDKTTSDKIYKKTNFHYNKDIEGILFKNNIIRKTK